MQNEVTEVEHFNTIHKKYDLQYGYKDKFVKHKIAQRVKGLKNDIPQSNVTILEIGCGTGEYTKQLAINFPKSNIYAFDISEEMIKEAKKKCKGIANIRFFVDNAYKTRIKMKFDFVIGFYVLPYQHRYLFRIYGVHLCGYGFQLPLSGGLPRLFKLPFYGGDSLGYGLVVHLAACVFQYFIVFLECVYVGLVLDLSP